MLLDRERKLLRILYNYFSVHQRMPRMLELKAKTGGDEESIQRSLQTLVDEAYILWEAGSPVEQIIILEGWERKRCPMEGKQPLPSHTESGSRYWTEY
ncbi:hypothetical protein ACIFOE_04845 [Paenibacillus sp. NRS-1783]|uniref:hypothetical protein n=1 Tax=Paenibacillus sp. NRS-1783 TaxID=3233907 RepID=UPI003D2A3977